LKAICFRKLYVLLEQMAFFFLCFLHLHGMKKKQVIINLFLMMAVLFAMLFQSFHSYEHLAKQLSQKQCQHKYDLSKTEFTHHHNNFDHCFVCEFTFVNFISPERISYYSYPNHGKIPYFYAVQDAIISFSGSLFALRGPPVSIV